MLALVATAISLPAGQSTKPAEKGYRLTGMVVNALTGAPITGAEVNLSCDYQLHPNQSRYCDNQFSAQVRTNAMGQFVVPGLKSGIYVISIESQGFEPTPSARPDPDAIRTEIRFAPARMKVKLTPSSVFHGRVTDTSGKPVLGVMVQVIRPRARSGLPVLETLDWAVTDRYGRYRMAKVGPGPAFVRAVGKADPWPEQGSNEGFLPVYYPGRPNLEGATQFECSPASDHEVSLQVRLQRTYRIRGQLRGQLPAHTPKFILMRGNEMADHDAARMRYDPASGSYELRGVINGSYLMEVVQEVGERLIAGQVHVTVSNQDTEHVEVTFVQPFDVPCRVAEEGAAAKTVPMMHRMPTALLRLEPIAWGIPPITEASQLPDGSCVFPYVPPGTYRIVVQSIPGRATSVKVGEMDVTSSGMVTLKAGESPPTITVIIR